MAGAAGSVDPRRRAGASHGLLDWLTELNAKQHVHRLQYSVGFGVTQTLREAIVRLPETVWAEAIEADGEARDGAGVAEVTGLLPAAMCGPRGRSGGGVNLFV